MYMAGSERRNSVVVVFMGSQPAGRNGMRGRVHPEGLDGTCDGNEACRTAQRRKWASYVRNGVLLIGRGVAYRKTEETDLLRSKRGPVDREGCGIPQMEETDLLQSKWGSC